MKGVKGSLFALLVYTLICCFFAPFFLNSSVYYSFYEIIKSGSFNGFFTLNLLPFVLAIISCILHLFYRKSDKFVFISFLLNVCSIVLTVFEITFINMSVDYLKSGTQLAVGAIIFIFAEISFSIYQSSVLFSHFRIGLRDIIEIGIFVAFAIVLDIGIFKIRIGANGGSISLVMIPLFIICLRKGFFKGFFATGLVYGLVNCLLDGYGLMYYPFDYLLGFGSLAILGLFRKLIFNTQNKFKAYMFLTIGVICALIGRLLSSTLSGMIYYGLNFWGSFVYNITYIGPSGAVALVALLLLFSPLKKIENKHNSSYSH